MQRLLEKSAPTGILGILKLYSADFTTSFTANHSCFYFKLKHAQNSSKVSLQHRDRALHKLLENLLLETTCKVLKSQ